MHTGSEGHKVRHKVPKCRLTMGHKMPKGGLTMGHEMGHKMDHKVPKGCLTMGYKTGQDVIMDPDGPIVVQQTVLR